MHVMQLPEKKFDPIGESLNENIMQSYRPIDFKNWLPVRLFTDKDTWKLKWLYMHDVQFDRPFFDETIGRLTTRSSLPSAPVPARTTPLEALPEIADALDAVSPSLLIFHTSRCGSTLVSQVLSLNPAFIVVSEYLLIDRILRITDDDPSISAAYRDCLLKALFKVVGQKRFGREEALIVKMDPWDFVFFEHLSLLFPKSRKVLMFRDPDAIWASIQKRQGMQFVPQLVPPKYFDIDLGNEYFPDLYCDLVLQKMYGFIRTISQKDKSVLLLNYHDDMRKNIQALFEFIQLGPGAVDAAALEARLSRHSKYPDREFVPVAKAYGAGPISRKTRDAYLGILNDR